MAAASAAVDLAVFHTPVLAETSFPSTIAVDGEDEEPPLSPLERKTSLEKRLQLRPEAQDLKNRHILLDTSAAP